MERGILAGIAVFRWVAWVWMAVLVALSAGSLHHAWIACALILVALAVTALDTHLLRTDPARLLRLDAVLAELAVGATLAVASGYVYATGAGSDALGWAWPMAGVFTAGVAFGPLAGAGAGLFIGSTRFLSAIVNGISISSFDQGRWMSLASTVLIFVVAGAVAGQVTRLLRRAQHEVERAQAREEVARTLHDGVLQTLTIIERRTDDPQLAALARDQERDLREYLFGQGPMAEAGAAAALGPGLRAAAARYEQSFGGTATVVLAPDLPELSPAAVDALVGAAREALHNAGKHGAAGRITVYVEPGDPSGVVCSIHDDGTGFDPAAMTEGVGWSRSIRGRLAEVGGGAEVESQPGAGVEVRMWLP